LLLLWLAWKSWQELPPQETHNLPQEHPLRNFATTFLLTLSNPMTILSFAALIASSGSQTPEWLVAGIFAGSMLWWIILSAASSWAARFIEIRGFLLNRAAAITLAAFGIWAIYSKGLK
jgi:putative LysE/RhtB family amino acid efflux pump